MFSHFNPDFEDQNLINLPTFQVGPAVMINDFDPNVHLDNMKPDSNESANDDSVFEDTETEMRYEFLNPYLCMR